MDISRYKLSLLASVAVAFGLTGCGGNGSIAVPILYNGTYSGTYTGTTDSGTMNFTVDSIGSITGTVVDTTANQTASMGTANIDNSGHFYVAVTFPNGASDVFQGNVSLNSSNHMTGTITESGTVTQQVNVDFSKPQSAARRS
jgi:hypothetical protein